DRGLARQARPPAHPQVFVVVSMDSRPCGAAGAYVRRAARSGSCALLRRRAGLRGGCTDVLREERLVALETVPDRAPVAVEAVVLVRVLDVLDQTLLPQLAHALDPAPGLVGRDRRVAHALHQQLRHDDVLDEVQRGPLVVALGNVRVGAAELLARTLRLAGGRVEPAL